MRDGHLVGCRPLVNLPPGQESDLKLPVGNVTQMIILESSAACQWPKTGPGESRS